MRARLSSWFWEHQTGRKARKKPPPLFASETTGGLYLAKGSVLGGGQSSFISFVVYSMAPRGFEFSVSIPPVGEGETGRRRRGALMERLGESCNKKIHLSFLLLRLCFIIILVWFGLSDLTNAWSTHQGQRKKKKKRGPLGGPCFLSDNLKA
ncbi:uncharacterized protein LY79DRAFT_549443 [Colletotrichum navitas]|uniref:Uncharacterized protein n=1 Tax=Colletotrichum navitas TaxID=681940 RepID=A0AAD8Q3G8_9PEZI|nr:uncharacterized protein LY79DRAFT_549443 [Colletotrichum navitas]KAK1594327.1 hypothetical protein LY79DRAFT_549443 [Colletotrichum navitas]